MSGWQNVLAAKCQVVKCQLVKISKCQNVRVLQMCRLQNVRCRNVREPHQLLSFPGVHLGALCLHGHQAAAIAAAPAHHPPQAAPPPSWGQLQAKQNTTGGRLLKWDRPKEMKYIPRWKDSWVLNERKLDGVGPVDNRPSTKKLHHFVKKQACRRRPFPMQLHQ